MWWKILSGLLILFALVAGFLNKVPALPILNETIRNLYFHVPMWFGMTTLLLISTVYSILYLRNNQPGYDHYASEAANTGLLFGILGIGTGMIWAKYAWGAFWVGDPKLNSAAIGILMYLAYIILRGSFNDDQQRARISAVYNIFAFPVFISLIYILPRLTDSLHPGNGGNPGFSNYDLNNEMRKIFYPAVVGFILLGWWITTLRVRIRKLENKLNGIY